MKLINSSAAVKASVVANFSCGIFKLELQKTCALHLTPVFSYLCVFWRRKLCLSALILCALVSPFRLLYVFVGNIKHHRSVLNHLNNGNRRQARKNFFNCISLCSSFQHSFVPIAIEIFDVFIKSNSCMRIAQSVLLVGFHAMERMKNCLSGKDMQII